MNTLPHKTALIVIDVQKGFDDPQLGARNNLFAEDNIFKLIALWRKRARPIVFIQHASLSKDSPLHPSKPGFSIKDAVKPLDNEKIIQKNKHSAFVGTELMKHLNELQCNDIIITGLTTDHCVSTTTRHAFDLDFNVILVADGTATFDRRDYNNKLHKAEDLHLAALTSLHEEFAFVTTTEAVCDACL